MPLAGPALGDMTFVYGSQPVGSWAEAVLALSTNAAMGAMKRMR